MILPQHNTKKNIRQLTLQDIKDFFKDTPKPNYRSVQIYEWLWKKGVNTFQDMTNVDKQTIALLDTHFYIPNLSVDQQQESQDGTIKIAFKTFYNDLIEAVLIPTETRLTVCISSQVGCGLKCSFCATGKMGFQRNLSHDEIYEQVFKMNQLAQERYQKNITNIVFMGMGEPLLNYKNVLLAIDKLTSSEGLHMSPRRITVSTAGIAKMITQLGDDKVRFNLALSLHAANNDKRNALMHINEKNNIQALREALNYFYQQTKNDITLEYVLLEGVNDSLKDAEELFEFYKKVPTHLINIIEHNEVSGIAFKKTNPDTLNKFLSFLQNKKVNVRVRKSRGSDIDAACGQLATLKNKGNRNQL